MLSDNDREYCQTCQTTLIALACEGDMEGNEATQLGYIEAITALQEILDNGPRAAVNGVTDALSFLAVTAMDARLVDLAERWVERTQLFERWVTNGNGG